LIAGNRITSPQVSKQLILLVLPDRIELSTSPLPREAATGARIEE